MSLRLEKVTFIASLLHVTRLPFKHNLPTMAFGFLSVFCATPLTLCSLFPNLHVHNFFIFNIIWFDLRQAPFLLDINLTTLNKRSFIESVGNSKRDSVPVSLFITHLLFCSKFIIKSGLSVIVLCVLLWVVE